MVVKSKELWFVSFITSAALSDILTFIISAVLTMFNRTLTTKEYLEIYTLTILVLFATALSVFYKIESLVLKKQLAKESIIRSYSNSLFARRNVKN